MTDEQRMVNFIKTKLRISKVDVKKISKDGYMVYYDGHCIGCIRDFIG